MEEVIVVNRSYDAGKATFIGVFTEEGFINWCREMGFTNEEDPDFKERYYYYKTTVK